MDLYRAVFDSAKAEKANEMRRYRWRQNLLWLLKACLPLAPLSYALCRDLHAPRQLIIAVFNSNLCVFLLLNALVAFTCFLSTAENVSGAKNNVSETDIYGEYVANVGSTRQRGNELVTPEVVVKNKQIGIEANTTTSSPEEAKESNFNVDSVFVPVCEDKAVIAQSQIVVYPVAAVTESEKVMKFYRRTQSEKETRKPIKRGLERSVTKVHRKSKPENVSAVEKLSPEEFQRQVENFIKTKKMIQRLEEN